MSLRLIGRCDFCVTGGSARTCLMDLQFLIPPYPLMIIWPCPGGKYWELTTIWMSADIKVTKVAHLFAWIRAPPPQHQSPPICSSLLLSEVDDPRVDISVREQRDIWVAWRWEVGCGECEMIDVRYCIVTMVSCCKVSTVITEGAKQKNLWQIEETTSW